jgi:hypothetical protein
MAVILQGNLRRNWQTFLNLSLRLAGGAGEAGGKVPRSEPASLSPVPVRKVEPMKRQDGALGKAIEEIRRRVESAGQKQASAPAYPGGEQLPILRLAGVLPVRLVMLNSEPG